MSDSTWLDELETRLASLPAARAHLDVISVADLRRLLRVARAAGPLIEALDDAAIEHVGHECPMWPEGFRSGECTCGARFVRERAEALRAALHGEGTR